MGAAGTSQSGKACTTTAASIAIVECRSKHFFVSHISICSRPASFTLMPAMAAEMTVHVVEYTYRTPSVQKGVINRRTPKPQCSTWLIREEADASERVASVNRDGLMWTS